MLYKFGRCVCLQLPDPNQAVEFYKNVMGLEVVGQEGKAIELQAGHLRLFFDQGASMGPILEVLVPNVEKAKEELLQAGCEVVRWEGKGGCCYMRDPFGFVFNLYEEPEAFQD